MDFREATDRLIEKGISLADIAEGLGLSYSSVKQARIDRSSASFRNPPAGWPVALAKLVRTRRKELAGLAEELERVRPEG